MLLSHQNRYRQIGTASGSDLPQIFTPPFTSECNDQSHVGDEGNGEQTSIHDEDDVSEISRLLVLTLVGHDSLEITGPSCGWVSWCLGLLQGEIGG